MTSLKDLIRPEDILVGFDPSDKWDAIRMMTAHLVETGRAAPEQREALHEQVVARERSMSTGMEHGIAIPHAAVEGIDELMAALGVVQRPDGLNFESIDARPTRLIVLLLIPRAQKLLHIRTLAEVARVLGKETVRDALLAATTQEEAWEAMARGETAHPV